MTQPFPHPTGPKRPEAQLADVPEPHGALCRQARALAHDVAFLAGVRRSSRSAGDLLRPAQGAVPALELLPLGVRAEELGSGLTSTSTGQRGWSA